MHKERSNEKGQVIALKRIRPVPIGANYDHKVWVHRNVGDQSQIELDEFADRIISKEASRKFGRFAVSIVYPEDVRRVVEQSDFRGLPVANQIARVLSYKFPDSLCKPVIAEVVGLRQYSGKIGLELSYPEYKDENQAIADVMAQFFGTNNKWNGNAHTSIATGRVEDLSNISVLNKSMPAYASLTPVKIDISIDYTHLPAQQNESVKILQQTS